MFNKSERRKKRHIMDNMNFMSNMNMSMDMMGDMVKIGQPHRAPIPQIMFIRPNILYTSSMHYTVASTDMGDSLSGHRGELNTLYRHRGKVTDLLLIQQD